MYQTIARILGTIVLSCLVSHGYLTTPFVGTFSADQVTDIGLALVFSIVTIWAYLEKLLNGHITFSGKTVIIPPISDSSTPIITSIPPQVDLKDK